MARVSGGIVVIELMNKFLWFGLGRLSIILRPVFGKKNNGRCYFPWNYRKITGDYKKKYFYGFGVGLPFSDFIFGRFSVLIKMLNFFLSYFPLKYIASKMLLAIDVERKNK